MKAISSILIVFVLAMTLNLTYGQSADEKVKEYEKHSMMLIQKLYSCHSMAYTIMGEKDNQTRFIYYRLANKYSDDAQSAFIKMKSLDENMDVKLRENIATLLQLYAKAFESLDALNKPETAVALSFSKHYLKKLNEDLLCKLTDK
jgi:hypothetical protein